MIILRNGYRRLRSFPAPEAAMTNPKAPSRKPSPKAAGSRSRGSIAVRRYLRRAGFVARDGASARQQPTTAPYRFNLGAHKECPGATHVGALLYRE
jgi:hypothetical protein